jgi:hypothetical protein
MVGLATAEGRIGAVDPDARKLINSDGGVDGFPHADFALNTQQKGSDGFMYLYVQADGAIPASQVDIAVDAAGQATDGAGTFVNTLAFLDNEFGFVRNVTRTADAT